MKAVPVLLAAALAACAGHSNPLSPDAPPGSDAAGAGSDAAPAGFTTLISRSWNLSQGTDDEYRCTRIQVPTDMWVSAFHLLGPQGTHDVVVTFDPNEPGNPSGDYTPCNATTGTQNGQMIYAAGQGTDDLHFPDGVAIHLAAGQWINLNLHLYKNGGPALSDTSGVQVETVPKSQVVHEADAMFSGTQTIDVPSDGYEHYAKGGCTASADWHLFALWPHMHETGTHQSFEVIHTATGTVSMLLDAPFQPMNQVNHPMQDTPVAAGDQILTTCTYVVPAATCDNGLNPCALGTCNINDHKCYVQFGDNALAENCYTAMYKYPAGGSTYGCTEN